MTDKQPEAFELADLIDGDSPVDTRIASFLRTQHAALERKDALLRQALEALIPEAAAHTVETKQTRAVEAIRKELQ